MRRRLFRIAAVTVFVLLLFGMGLWVYLKYFAPKIIGGTGTKVVSVESLSGVSPDIFGMPGDSGIADVPLAEILPNGWENRKRRIIIEKSARILTVYAGRHKVKSYFCALGGRPIGPKTKRDDSKTPEGIYYVCSRNPKSKFELSLLISYPGMREAKEGFKNGLINESTLNSILESLRQKQTPPQDTALGSLICIHGGGIGEIAKDLSKARIYDWTQGCIALRSEDIREVYDFADPGTTVEIRP